MKRSLIMLNCFYNSFLVRAFFSNVFLIFTLVFSGRFFTFFFQLLHLTNKISLKGTISIGNTTKTFCLCLTKVLNILNIMSYNSFKNNNIKSYGEDVVSFFLVSLYFRSAGGFFVSELVITNTVYLLHQICACLVLLALFRIAQLPFTFLIFHVQFVKVRLALCLYESNTF